MHERIRVVVAGPDRDGGDPTAEILARAMRDAGMEVVYTDRPHAPRQLVATVVQEDADAVGLALPEGADEAPLGQLIELLAERGVDDVVVFAGGRGEPAEVVAWLRERLSR